MNEDRLITIGPTDEGLLLVGWVERMEDVVRIIDARWATKRETRMFEEYVGGTHERPA